MLAGPSHKDHLELSAWVADVTGTVEPFDPGFLDGAATNRALSSYFQAVLGPHQGGATAPNDGQL